MRHILCEEWGQVMLLMSLCNTEIKVCCPCVALGTLSTGEHLFSWFGEGGQTWCQHQPASVSLCLSISNGDQLCSSHYKEQLFRYFFCFSANFNTFMRPVCFDWFIFMTLMMLRLSNVETLASLHQVPDIQYIFQNILSCFYLFIFIYHLSLRFSCCTK